MTRAQVLSTAGKPAQAGARCWNYRMGRGVSGMRFCFADGRVDVIQTARSTGTWRRPPLTPWRAVIDDWYDGRKIDHPHQCFAVRGAIAHVPLDGEIDSQRVRSELQAYARRVC